MLLAPTHCCLLQEKAGCEAGSCIFHKVLLPALLHQGMLPSAAGDG